MDILMKTIGAVGLVCIIIGLILKSRTQRNIIYIIGGILLEIYSIYLKDTVFIILQAAFTIAAIYDLIRHKKIKIKYD